MARQHNGAQPGVDTQDRNVEGNNMGHMAVDSGDDGDVNGKS